MKRITLITLALAASLTSTAVQAADVSADAGAKIVAPLQIQNSTALYFGTIAPSLTANDTVIVSPAGAKNCGAELTCLTDDHTAAAFQVSGEAGTAYTIELPNSITISNGAGGEMIVNDFTGSKANGQLVSGQDDLTVGGKLGVAANQATGEYTGTFVVAVSYQ